eukprot:1938270-Amphidinium_carterae.1
MEKFVLCGCVLAGDRSVDSITCEANVHQQEALGLRLQPLVVQQVPKQVPKPVFEVRERTVEVPQVTIKEPSESTRKTTRHKSLEVSLSCLCGFAHSVGGSQVIRDGASHFSCCALWLCLTPLMQEQLVEVPQDLISMSALTPAVCGPLGAVIYLSAVQARSSMWTS